MLVCLLHLSLIPPPPMSHPPPPLRKALNASSPRQVIAGGVLVSTSLHYGYYLDMPGHAQKDPSIQGTYKVMLTLLPTSLLEETWP